ncbi:MAG TPA: hypothetical protein VH280_01300 [Verrucomicrobiae bacterium]|jgi:hypothetical protein|nr:hypothetical protein [Verrucomicrobiae bacterium]
MKKHGRKGILGKAVAGVCINGILVLGMVLAIPMFIKLANQAKAAQAQQQMEQQH